MANAKNLSAGTLYESISASTTTLLVYVGDGGDSTIKAVWPTAPFYATIMPANPVAGVANSMDSEIVLVNSVDNDQVGNTALSVTRAQRGTTAKAFDAGAVVLNGIYTEDILMGDYSTTEINTGRRWVDGKYIYKKTFTFTGKSSITHGITNIDYMVDMKCLVKTDNQWRTLPWLYSLSDAGWTGGVYVSAESIIFQVGTSLGNWNKGCITLEYTKTS